MPGRVPLLAALIAAACLLIVSPASAQYSYGGSATWTGTVTDADTGGPLADVCVLARAVGLAYSGDKTATTGADGTYQITGLTLGASNDPRLPACAPPRRAST